MLNKGHFIVVEGLEGAGKSTALQTIKQCLADEARDIEIISTREPGGTRVGEAVRTLLKESRMTDMLDARAELLLLYAARVQLVEEVILPALNRGCWVLGDRFELSTWAYQGGGRGLDEAMIAQLSTFCLNGFKPNLIFFLEISPQQGLERVLQRGALDRIEQEPLSFFHAVNSRYHDHISVLSEVVVIDASQPLAQVQTQIINSLKQYLSQHVI